VFSAEEIHALVRAAADPQDAAMFAAVAFTGLRMGELRALRWRDFDFVRCVVRVRGSYAMGELTTPKSGKVRSVPLIDMAARLLAVPAQRPRFTGDDDLVFGDEIGGWISDDRIRRRYTAALAAAGLRPLRFHDLRHTFGSLAITSADIAEVQAWMGHADIKTTMRYLHYRDRGEAARRLGEAFRVSETSTGNDWVPEHVGGGTEFPVQAGPAGLR
jgi:integrase